MNTNYLLAIIAILGGYGVFSFFRLKSAQGLLNNVNVKNAINKIEEVEATTKGRIQVEANKQQQIENNIKLEGNEKDTLNELSMFFTDDVNKLK